MSSMKTQNGLEELGNTGGMVSRWEASMEWRGEVEYEAGWRKGRVWREGQMDGCECGIH